MVAKGLDICSGVPQGDVSAERSVTGLLSSNSDMFAFSKIYFLYLIEDFQREGKTSKLKTVW